VAGFDLTRNYREAYGLFAASGILFNHESPRRGYEFVTRKITSQVAQIKLGLTKDLKLGTLEAKRDWGHAREYVKAMWMMLQQPEPDDFVICTGDTHSVREFCDAAFSHVGLDYRQFVVVDEGLIRPAEVDLLIGDAAKAKKVLGWTYDLRFRDLVAQMVDEDMQQVSAGASFVRNTAEPPMAVRTAAVRTVAVL
jgi:GDPmannose 4,6-dehydratase